MAITDVAGRRLNIEVVEHDGLAWVNVERPTAGEMAYLQEHYSFHPLDLEDCLSRVQLPKLDEYPDYLFLVLHFPLFQKQMHLTVPSEVDIFAGSHYVVTVHAGDMRPLMKLFRDCQSSEAVRQEVMAGSSGMLLYRVLNKLVAYSFPILNKIISNVESAEERIFDTGERRLVQELAFLRRDILSYRRMVRPQIDVLEAMEEKEFPFLKVNPDVYFGDMADQMRRLWVELEDLKESVDGLYDTHNSLTSQRTNMVIRVLTIIATIMLPLTVVSGLYGMNVKLLPLADDAASFWIILGVMGAIVVGMLAFFRTRHLL